MNTTKTIPMNASLGENLAFLAFPAERSAEQISNTTDELVKGISTLISQVVQDVIGARSRSEFVAARAKYLGRYMQLMMALGGLVSASVEDVTIDRLTHEALFEMEADFRSGGEIFGPEIQGQSLFTVWTLGKIHGLVQDCNAERVAGHLQEADLAFAREYVAHVLYARFHLDCLRMSLKSGKPLFPGVLEELSDGLRATVDAYAWVRQGRDLRRGDRPDLAFEVPWDNEQEQLLQQSTAEMLREAY